MTRESQARTHFFGTVPNVIDRLSLSEADFKTASEHVYQDFQRQLRVAVEALDLAHWSVGQAVVSPLEVQKALLPVVSGDPCLIVELPRGSVAGFRKAYSILAPAFAELPKLAMLFDLELNEAFYRSSEANGVALGEHEFAAEKKPTTARKKGGAK